MGAVVIHMKHMMGIIIAGCIVLLSGCSESGSSTYREDIFVFGTVVSITVEGVSSDQARETIKSVGHEMQMLHTEWHAWKPGALTVLNDAIARGEKQETSDVVRAAIAQAKQFHELSNGLFNSAMGSVIAAWGFHDDELPTGSLPSFSDIDALIAQAPSMDDVKINGRVVSSANPAVQFDFGGFGKGAALDRAEALLKEQGITRAMLNAGGDISTLGESRDTPWTIGIRHPVHWGAIASVALQPDEDIYTSGNYERFRESEGVRYSHIIDPRNGRPVDHIVSATVIAKNGALADAAATALSIAGPQEWYEVAKSMGVRYVMLIDEKGMIYLNPAMKDRIVFEGDEIHTLVVSQPLLSNQGTETQS